MMQNKKRDHRLACRGVDGIRIIPPAGKPVMHKIKSKVIDSLAEASTGFVSSLLRGNP